jgi:NitT/TauT family transport system substrate-binding protein
MCAVVLALLVGAVAITAQGEVADETFFLTFIPNIQFAPVYVALEKGYFEDAGINITLEHGDEPVGVDLIAANERRFGVISGEQVIAARANDRPVVMVYQWFHEYPVGIVAPIESGIETIADLAGRRVGVPGRFGASYSGLVALLSANGMTESDISLQEIGFNAPEVICVGGVDAAAVYINNEPLQVQNRADAGDCGSVTGVNIIPVADAANMVSNGLITNELTIAGNPELVQSMVAAFDAGNRDVILNPAEAYLLTLPYVENLPISDNLLAALENEAAQEAEFLAENPDADMQTRADRRIAFWERLRGQFDADTLLQFQVLLATIDLLDTEPLGSSDADAWATTEATLTTMGFLEAPIDLAGAYTNDFLPEVEGE